MNNWAKQVLINFVIICSGFGFIINAHGQTYDTAETFKASKILPSRLLKGTNFNVEDNVTSDGYLYIFQVSSKYGTYSVHGLVELEKLVYEIQVLDKLEKITRSKVFLDSAEKGGIDILVAPVKVVQNVAEAVTNPGETVETIKKVPQGVVSIFNWASEKVQSGTQYVAESVSDQKKQSSNEDLTDKAVGAATKVGLDHIGYSEKEGEWYKKYTLDPYTTNKPLRERIAQIVQVETAVKIGFKFVPGLGGLGALSSANQYLELARKVSVYADPKTLYNSNKLALQEMGATEDQIKQFLGNKNYSPTLATTFVDGVLKLKGVENAKLLLDIASTAKTPEGATFYTRSVYYLANKQEKTKYIKSIFVGTKLPVVSTNKGVIIPLPVDYATWTKDIDQGFPALVKKAKSNYGTSKITVVLDRDCSGLFKKQVSSLGATIVTNENFSSPYLF